MSPLARRLDITREAVFLFNFTSNPGVQDEVLDELKSKLKPYAFPDASARLPNVVVWKAGKVTVAHFRPDLPVPEAELLSGFGLRGFLRYERNRAMRVSAIPDDPLYGEQWALRRIGLEEAWHSIQTPPASAVTVAVVDSGTATAHPDLAGALWTNLLPTIGDYHGARFIGMVQDGAIEDDDGHGTRLAGTIAAVTNNAGGIVSAGWPAAISIMTLKFFDLTTPPSSASAAQAIAYAVRERARVINLSWDVGMPLDVLRVALDYAAAQDVVVVAAAGNDGTDNDELPTWPANYSMGNLISVMATDVYDDRASFSDYGATTVHLAAPGVGVLTTDLTLSSLAQYRGYGGTSAACALVSAAAALLRALNPGWPASLVREHLMASADVLPSLQTFAGGRLNRCAGRLNVGRAVRGPLDLIVPRAGDQWRATTLVPVEWRSEYRTAACERVEIRISDDGGATYAERLIQGVTNDGACTVKAPNRRIRNARLRIQSEQGHFYADSEPFEVRR
ncbi:MAG: S8 family serine peptidase [Candidatus Rokubacteria bacterium]|nr:S8 family serine peptidase [Candidatus Rokubacteria bacterium]